MSETPKQPGRTGVTYEQVAAAANALTADNRKPTLRAVREALGTGSMGTIQKHLSRWEEQRPTVHSADIVVSSEVVRALGDEIERHVSNATSALAEQLADAAAARDQLAEDGEAQALALAELEAQVATLTALTTEQTARLEELRTAEERERTAAERARVALAEANLKLEGVPALQAELERLRASLDSRTAELSRETAKAASLTAERDALAKQFAGVEQRASATEKHLERLQGELLAERERTGKAQAGLAAAEARAAATAERVTDLQAQLKTAADASAERVTDLQAQLKAAADASAAHVADLHEQLKAAEARTVDATRRAETAEKQAHRAQKDSQ